MKILKSLIVAGTACVLSWASSAALAYQQGDWILRGGATTVAPNDSSDPVPNPADPSTLIPGSQVAVDENTQLGLTLVYMLRDRWGLELLAATPFKHEISGSESIESLGKLAETKQLPPTLTLQYYLPVAEERVQPYVGLGVNFTTFFDEEVSSNLANLGATDISLEDSWGVAVEAGIDWNVAGNWLVNAALWYMEIDTEAEVEFRDGSRIQIEDVNIDPWVFNFGVGYRF